MLLYVSDEAACGSVSFPRVAGEGRDGGQRAEDRGQRAQSRSRRTTQFAQNLLKNICSAADITLPPADIKE